MAGTARSRSRRSLGPRSIFEVPACVCELRRMGLELCSVEDEEFGPALTTTYINVPIGYTAMFVAQSPGSWKLAECSLPCAPV